MPRCSVASGGRSPGSETAGLASAAPILDSRAMLAGLLFADNEAVDRPGQLTATLPFGGVTLIEYQARLLMAAGAVQIVVVVGRLTPELLGATGRIARRGIAVDTVRGAEEAAAKLHPLARVVVLADGLITTQDVVDRFAGEGGDALLVAEIDAAPRGYERLGGGAAWAGVARLNARRIAEVAGLPRDYDFASTLLRLADQARADHLLMGGDVVRDGHGIEHSAAALATRGRAVLAATVADRRNWFNALVLAPLARAAVPKLIARATGTAALAAGGVVLGLVGTAAVASGWIATGMVVALVASLLLGLGRVLAILRDEAALCRWQVIATGVVPTLVALALGFTLGHAGDPLALPAAAAAVFLGVVGERATLRPRRRRWWGSPPAYLLVATVLAIVGAPLAGLVAATLYAAVTLAAAVETLRPEA